jgi:hypothetical protein
MGLFKKIKQMGGGADPELLANGGPARGIVMAAQLTGTAVTIGVEEHRVVELTVQVFADGRSPYMTKVRQRVPDWMLPNIAGSALSLRIDPNDPTRAAVVLGEEPPVPTIAAPADGGAAALLARGAPAEAVIISSQPLGVRSHEGHEIQLLTLTVLPAGADPYQTQVGLAVPASALASLFPGSRMPAKLDPSQGPAAVVIDWAAAAPA